MIIVLFIIATLLWPLSQVHAVSQIENQDNQTDDRNSNLQTAAIIYVPSQMSLENAITQVSNGGVIEIAAGTIPTPQNGFELSNLNKSFTIRAASGARVVLDGGSARQILRMVNSNLTPGIAVTFENLVFANGMSKTTAIAAGITMIRANATFIGSEFQNNQASASGNSAGGIAVALDSSVFFFDTVFSNNTSNFFGGAIDISTRSKVYIHNSRFTNNRVNLPGHKEYAAGGAIHLGNSKLRISNSVFDGNQAGYVGGAIYAIGTWTDPVTTPTADVIVVNSTFINNQAVHDPGVVPIGPTEGGAFHAEDQTVTKIYNSRFIKNSADIGGGVNVYRANVEINGSEFKGNRAIGSGSGNGFGAAISVSSNDGNDATTNNGTINRPAARLVVRDSYIQGRFEEVTLAGQVAGGIYVTGDQNSMYGFNGVSKKGTLTDNRAVVTISNVVFNSLEVKELINSSGTVVDGTGHGGAMLVDLANLTIDNSLFMNSKALGTNNSSGGGLAVIDQSFVNITNSSFTNNTSEKFGGAIFVQGSTINLSSSYLTANKITTNFGAAVFAAPMEPVPARPQGLPVLGTIQSAIFTSNTGGPTIFDDDRTDGPINDVRYVGNQFYVNGDVNVTIYKNPTPNYGSYSADGLNQVVIKRANGTTTDKGSGNMAPGSIPENGQILAAPPGFLPIGANGEGSPAGSWLGYSWSGLSASLDNNQLSAPADVLFAGQGTHTLKVGTKVFSASIQQAEIPSVSVSAKINNSVTTLDWSISGGSFLDAVLDQGLAIPSNPTGSVQTTSPLGSIYRLFALTEEGGWVVKVSNAEPLLSAPDSILILAGKNYPTNGGILGISNSGGGSMQWTATSLTPDLISIDTPSGLTQISANVVFTVNISKLIPGDYSGTILIDAGEAGRKSVAVRVMVVNNLQFISFPVAFR